MFSFFKSKTSKNSELTFKTRVRDFWGWYGGVSARFFKSIEAGDCQKLASEVSEQIDTLLPGFAWVFGPGKNGKGHSFTLSGEGVMHKQLLAQFWLSQAPTLDGWTFYPARQPGSVEGITIKVGGRDFKPVEFWLTPTVNSERQKIDIVVWHPLFGVLEEKDRLFPLYLFLDEVLGEYGTEQWIGGIHIHDHKLDEAMPISELPAYIQNLQSKNGWKEFPPGEGATLYECQHPHNRFIRGDVIVGSTMHPRLINEYLAADGDLSDP